MSRNYPLEIILRHTGTAELVDAHDTTLWSSDADENFRETVSDELLTEEDLDEILDYLSENELLTDAEVARFESSEWDCTEESLEGDEAANDDPLGDEDEE